MDTPNPKRPRHDVSSSPIQNPDSDPDFNQSDFDSTISSFLLLPDSPDLTSIGSSFDRVLGQVLVSASEASGDDSVQDRLIDRAGKLAFLLLESTKRFSRMRASLYNYNSWPLPHDLTINVFSMLDTKSLMQASACCTMFRKCSKDPLCYSHIDLKMGGKRVYDEIVCSMIHKAGKELRSLKLGRVISSRKGSTFTRSCLASVILNHGFNGGLLTSLQLYNLVSTGTKSLCDMLSVCPNLTELKIANFDRTQILEQILKTLTRNPRLIIQRLLIQNNIDFPPASGLSCSTVEAFVTSCPSLTWLTLVGFKLKEVTVRKLAEGFPKLTHMNLSRTPEISGRFLRDLRIRCREPPLKTLILRDCPSLDEREIGYFLDALLNGHFIFIRHIDLTSHVGGGEEVTISKDMIKKLKEERSVSKVDIRLIPIPSHHPCQPPVPFSSFVLLDYGIYVIGGIIKRNPTWQVWLLDYLSLTWRRLRDMRVAHSSAAANVVDGKIYVFGGCNEVDSSDWAEVFDPDLSYTMKVPAAAADACMFVRLLVTGTCVKTLRQTLQPASNIFKRCFDSAI